MGFLSSIVKGIGSVGKGLAGSLSSVAGIPGLGPSTKSALTTASGAAGGVSGAFDSMLPFLEMLQGDGEGKALRKLGTNIGELQRNMMDQAYPGTSPHERLGVGQAGVGAGANIAGQKVQERVADKTLSNQKSIAEMNNQTVLEAKTIEQYPEMAPVILQQHRRGRFPPTPKASQESIGRLRVANETVVARANSRLAQSKVGVDAFNASTSRMMQRIAQGRLDWDKHRQALELELRDKELAVKVVDMYRNLYETMGGSIFRIITSTTQEIMSKASGEMSLLSALGQAVRQHERKLGSATGFGAVAPQRGPTPRARPFPRYRPPKKNG